MFDFLYSGLPQPRTVCRRMNGLYTDEKYHPLTLDEAVDKCMEALTRTKVIVKPNATSGGAGIVVFDHESSRADIRKHFVTTLGIWAFIAQEFLEQSPFMMRLNPSSVNTVRITTFLHKGQVRPLAALIRIGSMGSDVDNWCSGGSLLGLDIKTGRCNPYVMRNDHVKVSLLPTGLDVSKEELVLPNFDKLKEAVCLEHYRMPYVKMISWDMALDKNDMPTFIECNFAGMIQLHQSSTGPLFGDLTDEILDEYLLKRFFQRFATEDFICREYHDHIEIEEYISATGDVKVPETLREKPVTMILAAAFNGCEVKNFSAPIQVIKNSPAAIKSIS